VHSHAAWPVGVGELANEVGKGSVGDTGPAGLTPMATIRDPWTNRSSTARMRRSSPPSFNDTDRPRTSGAIVASGPAGGTAADWTTIRTGPDTAAAIASARRVIADVRGTCRDPIVGCTQLLEAVTVAGHGDHRHPGFA